MSEATPPPAVMETKDNALVARISAKLLEDKDLKALSAMVDQAASNPAISIVVLDMAKVHIIPSLGLGVLVQMSAKCKARQQRLKLAGVLPSVRQVLSITRLDRVLELSDSVEAALE